MAAHMEAVLDVEGPHDLVNDDVEEAFLVFVFKRESDRLRDRAARMRR